MKTMYIGGALLATITIVGNGLYLPAHSAGKSANTATAQKTSKKTVRLAVDGMH